MAAKRSTSKEALELIARAAKRRANKSPAVRPTARARAKRKPKKLTLAEISAIAEEIDKELGELPDREFGKTYKNRYGLPKASVFSFINDDQGKEVARWDKIRTRYSAQLEDAIQAFEAGVITQAEYERRTGPIGEKYRWAQKNLDAAMRVTERGLQTPRKAVRKPTPRRRQ